MKNAVSRSALAASLSLLMLTACGGGGDDSNTVPPETPAPSPTPTPTPTPNPLDFPVATNFNYDYDLSTSLGVGTALFTPSDGSAPIMRSTTILGSTGVSRLTYTVIPEQLSVTFGTAGTAFAAADRVANSANRAYTKNGETIEIQPLSDLNMQYVARSVWLTKPENVTGSGNTVGTLRTHRYNYVGKPTPVTETMPTSISYSGTVQWQGGVPNTALNTSTSTTSFTITPGTTPYSGTFPLFEKKDGVLTQTATLVASGTFDATATVFGGTLTNSQDSTNNTNTDLYPRYFIGQFFGPARAELVITMFYRRPGDLATYSGVYLARKQ